MNPGTDPDEPDPGPPPPVFAARLEVSNPTPQANEEVRFQCIPAGTFVRPVQVDFESSSERLEVDAGAGTARLIITQPDVGQTIEVSCTAIDAEGRTATSSTALVTPT